MQTSNGDDLLQFKDYSNTSGTTSPPAQINVNSPTHQANDIGGGGGRTRGDPLSQLIYDMSNVAQTLDGGTGGGTGGNGGGADDTGASFANGGKVSFLTMEYYQQFFNVDTYMVLERIANAMIPNRAGSSYLRDTIGKNPDLYGPFWITVTLIFSIAISGNIASYLQHAQDDYNWRYNFHLVSYASTCIFMYANLVPAVVWALFKYNLKPVEEGLETENANYTPSLLSLMCIYGYSLAIYIPVSILWVIQISIIQWLLVISAALLSGSVLILVLTPALRNSKLSLFLIIGILAAHFLLAAGFMLYFFHVPNGGGAVKAALPVPPQPQHAADVHEPVVGNLVTEAETVVKAVREAVANVTAAVKSNLTNATA